MWDEILNLAIKNGLWAVLFLGLFVFVIKDSKNREKKYHQIISDLTEHLGVVTEIKEDVDEIKDVVFKNKKTATKSKKTVKNTQKMSKKTSKLQNFNKFSNFIPSKIVIKSNKIEGDKDEK